MASLTFLTWTSLMLSTLANNPLPPRTGPALTGAVYLPPANLSLPGFSKAIHKAYSVVKQSIESGQSPYGPIDNLETSFSVSVFPAESNETIFDFHFEAP
jgi:hypothetical protein